MSNEENFDETELDNLKALKLEEQIEDDNILSDSDDPQVYHHPHILQTYPTIIHHKMKIIKTRIGTRKER